MIKGPRVYAGVRGSTYADNDNDIASTCLHCNVPANILPGLPCQDNQDSFASMSVKSRGFNLSRLVRKTHLLLNVQQP